MTRGAVIRNVQGLRFRFRGHNKLQGWRIKELHGAQKDLGIDNRESAGL